MSEEKRKELEARCVCVSVFTHVSIVICLNYDRPWAPPPHTQQQQQQQQTSVYTISVIEAATVNENQ